MVDANYSVSVTQAIRTAKAFGGLKTLKAISAPYTTIKFIPTGGIRAGNVIAYLEHPKVVACGGSWMVRSETIFGLLIHQSAITMEKEIE